MPLGKIIKLLKGVFQKLPAESVDSSELPDRSYPSRTATENTDLSQNNVSEITLAQPTAETSQTSLPKILDEKKVINVSMLQDELQNFVSAASDVQGAALVSPDGLALASVSKYNS